MKQWFTLLLVIFSVMNLQAQDYYLFIGTYTKGNSEGIYVYRFNTQTGIATPVSVAKTDNPSYLALSPDGRHVYAVNENSGKGSVCAFSFDQKTGTLQLVNCQPSGNGPCYVSTDPHNRWVISGNYGGGSISAFPVKPDGSLGEAAQTIQHEGHGPHPTRQTKAHVHAVVFSPDHQYLFTPDLGLDKVMAYHFDVNGKRPLRLAPKPYTSTDAGSGPRHLVFSADGRYAYLVEELSGSVTAFRYHNGQLTALQTLTANKIDQGTDKSSADLHLSPDGNFLYVSNRGQANNIAVFAVDRRSGELSWTDAFSTIGKKPRNFVITPDGKFLLSANQESDNVVIFSRTADGKLTPTGRVISVGSPVCLKMLEIK